MPIPVWMKMALMAMQRQGNKEALTGVAGDFGTGPMGLSRERDFGPKIGGGPGGGGGGSQPSDPLGIDPIAKMRGSLGKHLQSAAFGQNAGFDWMPNTMERFGSGGGGMPNFGGGGGGMPNFGGGDWWGGPGSMGTPSLPTTGMGK